jgi:NifB/MoaA-like Fe-S oxidoreductase
MLKQDEDLFLDDLTLDALASHLKTRIAVVKGPHQLLEVLLKGPELAERYV